MDNQAQANIFWIVIGAVIALVVLVVLLLIFTGKTGMLEKGLMSCEGKGGRCVSCSPISPEDCNNACKEQLGESYSFSSVFNCPNKESQGCCVGVSGNR